MPKCDVEDRIEQLNRLRGAAPAEAAAEVRKALADRINLVVAKGATIAAELGLSEAIPDLLRAFDRLFEKPLERDPQCWGKNAIAKALVDLDHRASEPFLRGASHIQMEPVWGGQEDTAATLRGTCLLALAASNDLRRETVLRHLVDGVADRALPVRIEALRALEQMAGHEAALLLRLKALAGDREVRVTGQAFDSLLNLEGEDAVPFLARFLTGGAEELREEVALALGGSRLPAAIETLRKAWDPERDPAFQPVLLRAISSSRHPEAIDFLLRLVREGRRREASDALEALALHRGSPEIARRVEQAVKEGNPDAERDFRRLFAS